MSKQASKPAKRVWNVARYTVDIGAHEYVVEPQPLLRLGEFDDVLSELGHTFDDLADQFYVQDASIGDDVAGPFENWEQADQHIRDNELEGVDVRFEGVSLSEFFERLLASPFLFFKPLIPDLTEEDAHELSIPQIRFLLDLLVEVNGLKWFEGLLKNVVEPLLPKVLGAAVGAAETFVGSTTRQRANGETPSITS